MEITLSPEFQKAYNYLSDLRRTNSPREENLCLSLEWYGSLLSDGAQITIANWYDFIREYKEALQGIQAIENVDFISLILSKAVSAEEVKNLSPEVFETHKKELERELFSLLDEEVADMRMGEKEFDEEEGEDNLDE